MIRDMYLRETVSITAEARKLTGPLSPTYFLTRAPGRRVNEFAFVK